jgi:hypothetical protein
MIPSFPKGKPFDGREKNLLIFDSYPNFSPLVPGGIKLRACWVLGLGLGGRQSGQEINFRGLPISWYVLG